MNKTRLAVIAVVVLIGVALWFIWAPTFLPVKDRPGERIYITAKQAKQWAKDKPLAFVQLSFPTCPFCIAAGPAIEKLVAEYDLHLAYVDIKQPENEFFADEMDLQATPTIWAFYNGEPVGPPIVGNVGEDAFREFFLKHMEATGQFSE